MGRNDKQQELLNELADLRADIKGLKRERAREEELLTARERATTLEEDIVSLQIKKDKLEEDNARKLREVEHKVGLEKKRQEQELELAKRDAELSVREENLDDARDTFKRDMEFQRERLQGEVDRVERILTQVLTRLPDVSAALELTSKQ